MMIVHQAIYGDNSGAYALLKTSLTDTELAKRICNVTDLLDRPSSGHLTEPVIRGFAFNNSYIFIKSFPDNEPSIRKGRVLSHTLIINQDDLHQLNDLNKLFSHFLPEPDKYPNLMPIVIENANLNPTQIVNKTSREASAINGMLHHSSYNNTIIWIGEEGYFAFVAKIWNKIEGHLKRKLRLGVGFNPQKIDTQKFNILYVLEDYESKWKASDFCIIGKEDIGILESMSSYLLAGQKDKSEPLNDLIKTFGVLPTEFEDYEYLEAGVTTYKNLSPTTDFNSLIVLCDLISKYSPEQKVAKAEKQKLIMQVSSRINLASAEQIFKLKNADWKGFLNGQQLIGDQIANWIGTSLFSLKDDGSIANIISTAFDLEKKEEQWWKKTFAVGLKTTLEKWKPTYAIVLWNWFKKEYDLVKKLDTLLPITTQIETDFVFHWQKPARRLAFEIQAFARKRKWLRLHALSVLQLFTPEKSIKSQLKIDTDPEYSAALTIMGNLIPDKKFLQLTVAIGELRLVKIVVTKVVKKPSLIKHLDVGNIIWRQIWLESIEQGMQPWVGIEKPSKILFTLLEEVIKGVKIEPKLLLKLSNSDYNDISNFKHRSEVWKHLDESIKPGFIKATTLGCVRLLDKKNIRIGDIEKEVQDRLIDPVIIERIIDDKMIKISTKIRLFEEQIGLREKEFLKMLNIKCFSLGESKRLGKLILVNQWREATDAIVNNIATRGDLKPALMECKTLLGFYEKLKLSISGTLSEDISTEEWLDELTKQCYTKYPKGPAEMGLWERAGGQKYDLLTKGSGREIWLDAIRKIKNGYTNVDRHKLLKEMLQDFSSSPELKELERSQLINYDK
ncbi:MAG: effector-associated domain EAD1-containing protein [Spirochaetia bacterium]|nr:effector-associated domain EAD1-containing protein [Spirochaetia bacterium]